MSEHKGIDIENIFDRVFKSSIATPLKKDKWRDIQGLVLGSYFQYTNASHFLFEIEKRQVFKDFLKKVLTSGNNWYGPNHIRLPIITGQLFDEDDKCDWPAGVNISFTYEGLKKLAVQSDFENVMEKSFPDFKQGARERAVKHLGDRLEDWHDAFMCEIHVIISLYKRSGVSLDVQMPKWSCELGLGMIEVFEAEALPGDKIHFGFRDDISQPWIPGGPKPFFADEQEPPIEANTLIFRDYDEATYYLPNGQDYRRLFTNGCFGAFRRLEQRVAEFEEYLARVSISSEFPQERIAAKMMGRWYNGTPLARSAERPDPELDDVAAQGELNLSAQRKSELARRLNRFSYIDDINGENCPYGAHLRRVNPRDSTIVGQVELRRLGRRNLPYGPEYNAYDPATKDIERGLMGFFTCTMLEQQFEHIHEFWMNHGRFTGLSKLEQDPIVGANPKTIQQGEEHKSTFTIPLKDGRKMVLKGLPRFVIPRGGAYVLIPSITGLRFLAGLDVGE